MHQTGALMTVEHKSFATEWKADGETGAIEGYGAVFGNEDNYGDIIMPGAFNGSLNVRKVKMLWQHDAEKPIGVWDEVREDARGLFVKGRILLDVEKGKEAVALIKAGAIDGLSIGYRTLDAEYRDSIRYVKEVELWETSIVTFPANAMAFASVKSVETERDLERLLIDHGLSRKAAKAIAAQGKGYLPHRDDVSGNPDDGLRDAGLIEAVKKLTMALKG